MKKKIVITLAIFIIRKYVTDYLNKHPENMLNTKK